MKVTIVGHAGLMVESAGQRVLLDPILRETPLGIGHTVYSPGRALTLSAMPPPTVIVVTHAHFDHYDLESLSKLDRALTVLVPRDVRIARGLRELGFRHIVVLEPWQRHQLDGLTIRVTPSAAPVVEDEFGVLFDDGVSRFWHMSDAEVGVEVGRRLLEEHGPIDVVSAKYQPQARAHLATMFSLGADLDRAELVGWLEAACATRPRFAFPYAAGVVLSEPHQWMNHYIFPFSDGEIARLLDARLGEAGTADVVLPGDVIRITRDGVEHHRQAAAFVRHDATKHYDCTWEPFASEHLPGLEQAADRRELAERLAEVMTGEFARWLLRNLDARADALRHFVEFGVAWQLVVHAGDGERLYYGIDFGKRSLELVGGRLEGANYFCHVGGLALLRALKTSDPAARNLFTCAELRVYEKILHVRNGAFWYPPHSSRDIMMHLLPEPFVSFLALEYQGPVGHAKAHAPFSHVVESNP
jgi:hypothetical protein